LRNGLQAQSEVDAGDRLGVAGTVMRPAARLVDHHRQLLADSRDGEKPRRGDNGCGLRAWVSGLGGRRAGSGKLRAAAYSGLRFTLFLIECALGIKLQELLYSPRNWLGYVDGIYTEDGNLRRHR